MAIFKENNILIYEKHIYESFKYKWIHLLIPSLSTLNMQGLRK